MVAIAKHVKYPPETVQILGSARNFLKAAINAAAAGDNAIIAAPAAGVQIHIVHLTIQNVSAVTTTVIFKEGATAINGTGFSLVGGAGITFDGGPHAELVLAAASAFNINLGGANQHNGYVVYYLTTNEGGGA